MVWVAEICGLMVQQAICTKIFCYSMPIIADIYHSFFPVSFSFNSSKRQVDNWLKFSIQVFMNCTSLRLGMSCKIDSPDLTQITTFLHDYYSFLVCAYVAPPTVTNWIFHGIFKTLIEIYIYMCTLLFLYISVYYC